MNGRGAPVVCVTMKLLYLHSGEIDSGMANAVQPLHMCSAFAQL